MTCMARPHQCSASASIFGSNKNRIRHAVTKDLRAVKQAFVQRSFADAQDDKRSGLHFVTTPQSQHRFDSSPCTGAPSNRKILREENRPERARRAYITCAERNHHAAGTSRARSAHITFINLPEGHTSLARSAIITPQAHHAPIGRTSLLSTSPEGHTSLARSAIITPQAHHARGAQSSRRRHITRAERAHHFFVAGVPCSFVRNDYE